MYLCDWTAWQSTVCPVNKIAAEGFGGLKLKVGGSIRHGWSYLDPCFGASWEASQASSMLSGAYWFLTPDNPRAQAGLFVDTLEKCGGYDNWACWLDVEMEGVTGSTVFDFWKAWQAETMTQPLALYTRRSFWSTIRDISFSPRVVFPFLEEAHWVSEAVRNSISSPYASQQVKGVKPEWWDVGYGGWARANMLQFTDNALVAGKRTTASVFQGNMADLKKGFVL